MYEDQAVSLHYLAKSPLPYCLCVCMVSPTSSPARPRWRCMVAPFRGVIGVPWRRCLPVVFRLVLRLDYSRFLGACLYRLVGDSGSVGSIHKF